MPRFLWLGALACAIVVAAAIAFVHAVEPGREVDPAELDAAVGAPSSTPVLASAPTDVPIERAAASIALDGSEAELAADAQFFGVVEVHVVRETDHAPVVGARVRRHDGEEAETDSGGVAIFTDVPSGSFTLDVTADDCLPAQTSARVTRQEPKAVIELLLVPGRRVLVRLVDSLGRPFRTVDWQLQDADPVRFRLVIGGECAALGAVPDEPFAMTYRVAPEKDAAGPCWWVEIQDPASACAQVALGNSVVGCARFDETGVALDVPIDLATLVACIRPISLLVLADLTGEPVAGAAVQVANRKGRTDERGALGLTIASGAKFVVRVEAEGFAPKAITVSRPDPDPIVVRLDPGRRVRGQVLASDGRPAENVALMLARGEGPRLGKGIEAPRTKSDAAGMFEFVDVVPARYVLVLSFEHGGHSTWRPPSRDLAIDCTEGDVAGLTLRVEKRGLPSASR